MTGGGGFLAELKRRNVLRAGILYIGAIWALAQGISQLGPSFDLPAWFTRWFVIAGVIGFPFAMLFSWFFEWTPQGIRRESDVLPAESVVRTTGRKFDLAIIGVLAIAVVLLVTDRFVTHRGGETVISEKSIAVMPLVNMSGDQSNEYFSDGVSEELINTLGKLRDLTVIGRNSSFQFKGKLDDTKTIAAKLGVAYLLEGSVRKASDRVRIAVNLVRASNSVDVWSETYDRDLKDIFAVQSEIATSVAVKLQAVIGKPGATPAQLKPEAPPSGSVEAYTAYLEGRFYAEHADEAGFTKAVEQYQKATRLDPDYAEAWARLALASTTLGANYSEQAHSAQQYALSQAAIDTALRLCPDLATGHVAKANLAISVNFDFRDAEAELRRAAELDPQNGEITVDQASMLSLFGKLNRAVEVARAALVTDPMTARVHGLLGDSLALLGRFEEAEPELRKAIEIQPSALIPRIRMLDILIQRNDATAALEMAEFLPADSAWGRYMRAAALQMGADRRAADVALQAVIDHHAESTGYQIAQLYAIRGDADKMFEWLDRAWAEHDPGLTFLLFDRFTLRFKDDPRYAALVKKVGLPLENLATTETIPYRGR